VSWRSCDGKKSSREPSDTRGRHGEAYFVSNPPPGPRHCACSRANAVPKRVLVVDDQPLLRDVQVLLLREAGYAATALSGAREALARLADLRPDLIVLDMTMPGMDGRQFLHQLRADRAWDAVPVIVASGLTAEEMEPLAARQCDVLSKPFSDVALLASVRRLIGDA
jgi:CheY-like chemotaxis protein